MTHPFTTADADRLLGLADQCLEEWAENAMQSGTPDEEYEERNAEWQAIRPLLVAVPQLLDALEDILGDRPDIQGGICRRCGRDYRGAIHTGNCPSDDCPAYIARAAIAKAKGSAPAATLTCTARAQWAEHAVIAYAHAKEGREYDPIEEMASDLFADLCHLFVREGVSPELMMERARLHYEEECAKEGIIL
jgi:hypothetical protein